MDESEADVRTYFCYLIRSKNNATYIGITNNLKRRLRQHNGIISGGARSTASRRPWSYMMHIGPFTHRHALQFEWAWKHAPPKYLRGVRGRLLRLAHVLGKDRCTSNAPLFRDSGRLTVHIVELDASESIREALTHLEGDVLEFK